MAVWTLETESSHTEFKFAIEEDKNFFLELVKNYFEESKPAQEHWRILYMVRDEPMKHPDFFEIEHTDVIAISQKAVDDLKDFLQHKVELLPIETDAGRYYAINVLDIVDCLNREESDFTATKNGIIVSFSSLEFSKEKLQNHSIFKIPELPYQTFISDDIQELCEEKYLRGLIFNTESNLVWYSD